MARKPQSALPHSWSIDSWPAEVYPGTSSRGRYLVRVHREELRAAGALKRPGRELVIIGDRFAKWLERQDVANFEIAPNLARNATTTPTA